MTATTQFDYSPYAADYASRPDYVPSVLTAMLSVADARPGDLACDIGAGSAHMTIPLLDHGLQVDAVEPTPAMRAVGERRTEGRKNIRWHEGFGEDTGRPARSYSLVTFGSSFDRTDRARSLQETARILRPGGFFACAWNHRDLEQPLQAKVEALIHELVPGYQYGTRRADQSAVIEESGLFESPVFLSGRTTHRVAADAWCDAWSSHSTLGQQAGDRFDEVLEAIRELVMDEVDDVIDVPYVTRVWVARLAGGDRP